MLLSSWLGELCRGWVRVHSSTARRSNRPAPSLAPAVMALESRVLLSSYTVTNTNDSGSGSLRYEVGLANSDGNADSITFDPTVFATPQTITLTSGQIDLNDVGGLSITAPTAGLTISGNNSSRVFQVDSGSSANLIGLAITGGANAIFGGGLEVAGNASLTNCTVSGNTAKDSGGGIEVSGQLTLTNSTISKNTTARSGGGIDVELNKVCNITNSTITRNTAFYGGGVYSNGTLVLASSTVSGNHSSKNGGGVYINDGQATLTNLTISGNSSGRDGGGLNFWDGKATLNNVTISGNSASKTGGGIYASSDIGGTLTINNTIVAGNTLTAGGSNDITGSLTVSGSNNLIGTGGSGGLTDGTNGNLVGVANPQLGGLANNGGPTQTMALGAGSPAINRGMVGTGVPGADQRGVPRVDHVDIGAYQVPFTGPLVVNTTDGGNDTVPNKLTLFDAVGLANFRTTADPITFDPTVFATPQTITLTAGQLELTDSAATTITAPTAGLTISGNSASRVFKVDTGATADLTGLTITAGYTATYGGGVYVAGIASLTNCTVSGNRADGKYSYGGGIEDSGQLTLTNSTVSNNTSTSGGGIDVLGQLTMINSTVSNNTASQNGGGITVDLYNSCNFVNCTISGNTAGYGGGIFSNGTLALANSTVNGNHATKNGGGVYISDGQATLTNLTVSGNSAGQYGGGVNFWYGQAALTNVTISGNSASTTGGGIYADSAEGGTVTINNTIVAGNTLTAGGNNDITGTLTVSGSNNLIGTGGSGGLVNGTSGNQVGVANPLLTSLGSYGGPTQTMALLPGSPAINAGSNTLAVNSIGNPLTSDQRGFAYVGTVDVGAFEYQGTSLVVNTTADGTASAPGVLTLREAVIEANAMGDASNSITFDPTVFANPQTITLTGGELPLRNGFGTTITAPTAGLTISGNNTSRVFEVFKNAHATLKGLRLLAVTRVRKVMVAGSTIIMERSV
jgi:parallel beta-helix repeat protein/predicted outer membrane repeat protein